MSISPDQIEQTVFVASYEHKHGTDLAVAETEDVAYAVLAQWARENWEDARDADGDLRQEPPADDRETVGLYTAAFEDRFEGEYMHVTSRPLLRAES